MPVGDIIHIEGLYVKPQTVKTNTVIIKGEYCIFDTDGQRPIVIGDFSADDRFLDLSATPVIQAGHDANNLTSTPVKDRVTKLSGITIGSDMICKMAVGVEPTKKVGISRLDARTPVIAMADVANSLAPTLNELFGQYKHKEFATTALDSVLNDDGVIATGSL